MRVAVFSADPVIGEALSCLFTLMGGLEVVSCSSNLASASSVIENQKPDVLIVTEDFDDENGWRVLRDLKRGSGVKLLLLHSGSESKSQGQDVFDLRQSRLSGIATVLAAISRLPANVAGQSKTVLRGVAGQQKIEPASSKKLTAREHETAKLVSQGLTNPQIASILGISEATVKIFVSKLLRAYNCENRIQLALRILEPEPSPREARVPTGEDPQTS